MIHPRVLAVILLCGAVVFLFPAWVLLQFLDLQSVRGSHRAFFIGGAVLHVVFSVACGVQAVRLWKAGGKPGEGKNGPGV